MKFKIKYKTRETPLGPAQHVGKYFQTPCGNIMRLGDFHNEMKYPYYDTITIINTSDKIYDFTRQTSLTSKTPFSSFISRFNVGTWIILTQIEIDNILKDPVEYYKHYKSRN